MPPIATHRAVGAAAWLMASLPQGNATATGPGAPRRPPTTRDRDRPARQLEQQPLAQAKIAKMTASARASAAHAYQATLTSQDSNGTKKARPKASPQPSDPRRLRPDSATASSAGPAAASGHAPTGGNAADRPGRPRDQQQRPARGEPAERPGAPGPRPGSERGLGDHDWQPNRPNHVRHTDDCVMELPSNRASHVVLREGQQSAWAIVPNAERLSGGACTSLGVVHMTCTDGLSHD